MKKWLVWFSGCVFAGAAAAQGGHPFDLKATYDRPGLPVPHWEMQIKVDGQATYQPQRQDGGATDTRTFTLSPSGLAKLQASLDAAHGMQPCETKTKGIARMGQKTLIYQPQGGAAEQCSYNYTENKGLAAATEYLQAIALTLDDGARLEHLHRYDRLGLDPVMQQLGELANEGRAVELGSIRPALQSLAEDPLVLERVRTRAAQLLELAQREDSGLAKR